MTGRRYSAGRRVGFMDWPYEAAKHHERLPDGFKWVLRDSGNGSSAVLLGKTNRIWPGTMNVFTREFEYLTDPAVIVKFVADYARSIPPNRIDESITVEVRYNTSAYKRVYPPQGPGNAFYLRVPASGQTKPQAGEQSKTEPGDEREANSHQFTLFVLGALGCCICIWYLVRRWLGRVP